MSGRPVTLPDDYTRSAVARLRYHARQTTMTIHLRCRLCGHRFTDEREPVRIFDDSRREPPEDECERCGAFCDEAEPDDGCTCGLDCGEC